jgi:hypothetical protein
MPRLRYDPDRDYYAVLGVQATASPEALQRAFRDLAKECHPDRNPERPEWAKTTFQAVSEAYTILGNPATRREYDRLRWPQVRPADPGGMNGGWAARARAAYSGEQAHYETPAGSYADWARRAAPPPPRPEFSAGSPFLSLRALLRGPYGPLYAIMFLVVLFMPVLYMAVLRFNGFALDSVVLRAAAAMPDPACVPGQVMIDAPGEGAGVGTRFGVYGTASVPDMAAYVVEWAYLGFAQEALVDAGWQRAAPPDQAAVQAGLLAEVTLPAQTGIYALRLAVVREDGTALPPCVRLVGVSSP